MSRDLFSPSGHYPLFFLASSLAERLYTWERAWEAEKCNIGQQIGVSATPLPRTATHTRIVFMMLLRAGNGREVESGKVMFSQESGGKET